MYDPQQTANNKAYTSVNPKIKYFCHNIPVNKKAERRMHSMNNQILENWNSATRDYPFVEKAFSMG